MKLIKLFDFYDLDHKNRKIEKMAKNHILSFIVYLKSRKKT